MPVSFRVLCMVSALVMSCAGDDQDDKPAPTPCQQLERSLCERTTECAIQTGRAIGADREIFQTRCLASLARALSCQEPASGDFEQCSDALQDIPCDRVAASLDRGELTAPSTSCEGYFF